MTIETPIIHMNHGKTKSATVNPFHRALKIKSQNPKTPKPHDYFRAQNKK